MAGCQTHLVTGRVGKRVLVAGIVVGGALAAAVGVLLFVFRDRATPIGSGEVSATLVTGSGEPGGFGLYLYATSGFETTDALTGARHDYPAQTHLTIQPGGCGTLVRWQALRQRWDEWDICPDGSLAGWQAYHEWFGVSNLEVYTCSPAIPTQGRPGETWTGACSRAAGSNVDTAEDSLRYEVIGHETLTVGGEPVETLHIRMTSSGRGASESYDVNDTWILPGTHLLVRQVADHSSTTQSRIGAVRYREQYELTLLSLRPSS